MKATYGLVPTDGIVPLSWTMDHLAPMAATVADAALMLEVMAGNAGWLDRILPSAWDRSTVAGRVGPTTFEGCEPAIARLALDAMEALGPIVELERPNGADLDLANAARMIVSRCEASAFATDRQAYWDEVRDQLDAADTVTAADYLDAQRLRAVLAGDLLAAFGRCDVLRLPTVGVSPPMRDDFERFLTVLSRGCVPWSLAGFPAVSVPCGFDPAGLPVGLQIVGPPGADALVVAAAAAVERNVVVGVR